MTVGHPAEAAHCALEGLWGLVPARLDFQSSVWQVQLHVQGVYFWLLSWYGHALGNIAPCIVG
jgi:hypothetical protein